MAVTAHIDTRAFNDVLTQLQKADGREGKEFVWNAGRFIMQRLDIRTPTLRERSKSIRKLYSRVAKADSRAGERFWQNRIKWVFSYQDRAKAGWWPAWKKLGAKGMPRVKNASVRSVVGKDEGGLIDGRNNPRPFITIVNTAPHIEELDAKKSIVQSAIDFQTKATQRQLDRMMQRRLNRHG